jgi:hypothetical protein
MRVKAFSIRGGLNRPPDVWLRLLECSDIIRFIPDHTDKLRYRNCAPNPGGSSRQVSLPVTVVERERGEHLLLLLGSCVASGNDFLTLWKGRTASELAARIARTRVTDYVETAARAMRENIFPDQPG